MLKKISEMMSVSSDESTYRYTEIGTSKIITTILSMHQTLAH